MAGETAPLLFTSFGNRYWSPGWDQPTASLPVMIFTYAISPYEDWHKQAWAGGFRAADAGADDQHLRAMILSKRGNAGKMSPMQAPISQPTPPPESAMGGQPFHMQMAENKNAVAGGKPPKLSATNLVFHYGSFKALHGISLAGVRQARNGVHRTFRLRQVHLPADAEPDERNHPQQPRGRRRFCWMAKTSSNWK